MTLLPTLFIDRYQALVCRLEAMLSPWLLGLAARLVFLAVLLPYYMNSALTKFDGFFQISDNAYYQIALSAVEAAGGDVSAVSFLPWGAMVFFGSYGELILPVLIVIGLFTRLAALGMIAFIGVQTLTDIYVHNVDATTIGALFDRFPDSVIADQRLLWLYPLIYLAIKGAGLVSLDTLLSKRWATRH
uniref:DoxX family protein n=1 Tax=uncultured Rhizobium sp. TaxID=155567 RepID=UPI002611929F|nr:DoxX family protein [uncultured Rhizobium sp.]